jgi:hypothetical protein
MENSYHLKFAMLQVSAKQLMEENKKLRSDIEFLLEALQRIANEEDGLDHFGFAQNVIDEMIGVE